MKIIGGFSVGHTPLSHQLKIKVSDVFGRLLFVVVCCFFIQKDAPSAHHKYVRTCQISGDANIPCTLFLNQIAL